MKRVIDGLRKQCEVLSEREQRPDLFMVVVALDSLRNALTWLKRETGHVQLTLLSAVDWLEDGEFELSYLLTDPARHVTLIVGTRIPRDGARVPTVWDLWPQAVTYEQELSEMFGISFDGSPRSGVTFILESWSDVPPMRRDFDTAAYSRAHYEDQPGRSTIDARTRVGRESNEKGYTKVTGAATGRSGAGDEEENDE